MREILSTHNNYIKVLKSLKDKKGRTENSLFTAEGFKCVSEAINHADVESILVTDPETPLISAAEQKRIDVILTSDAVISSVSSLNTNPGCIAAVRSIPSLPLPEPDGIFVALEDLSDPQNVGTIIRTADAAGAGCVILTGNCADFMSPRAVRASMGSVFHVPVCITENLKETLGILRKSGMKTVGTSLRGSAAVPDLRDVCIVIGNESKGMSPGLQDACDFLYRIPMPGKAESLNAAVAAGIVIYKFV